mgnify:CR=1 FL=1
MAKGYGYWEAFPLTSERFHGLGTRLKAGGYRSTKNYIGVAKKTHIDGGSEWSDVLKLASSRFVASTLRGMGPSRQSEPIDFALAVKLDLPVDPVVPDGPLGSMNVLVVSVFFMLRELESGTAKRRNLRVNAVDTTVTMRLPVSNRDPPPKL